MSGLVRATLAAYLCCSAPGQDTHLIPLCAAPDRATGLVPFAWTAPWLLLVSKPSELGSAEGGLQLPRSWRPGRCHTALPCRELKRIDLLSMSPIFEHFGKTLHGRP